MAKEEKKPEMPEEEVAKEADGAAEGGGEEGGGEIPANVAAALCYVLGHVSGLLFLWLEKKNKTVRFHAMQAVVVSLGLWFIIVASLWIPLVGVVLLALWKPIAWVMIIYLGYKAYLGGRYKLPFFGDVAERWLERCDSGEGCCCCWGAPKEDE